MFTGVSRDASTDADERVAERGKLSDDFPLQPAVGLAPIRGRHLAPTRPPLALASIEDHGDVRLGRELAGEIREEIRLLPVDDEEVLRHGMIM
jgi:hypothetical protein